MKEVIVIGPELAKEIIDNRRPLGSFIVKSEGVYVAIDNETGDAWTEEFKTKEDCLIWLRHEEEEETKIVIKVPKYLILGIIGLAFGIVGGTGIWYIDGLIFATVMISSNLLVWAIEEGRKNRC